ncbi:MAG: isoaspartyl peptidase/L-asparaginase [Pirellulaceae bacterium]|nr:isoaspartyl peptidase/L-asparaginase [Pirellulaceae bacterium]
MKSSHPLSIGLLTLIILMTSTPRMQAQQNLASKPRFAIILHGGAGGEPDKWTEQYKQARRESLGQALDVGVKLLEGGGSSLAAVEAVVRVLEDDPMFNAGRGCVLNEQGEHELDASIMDGRNLACGAVAGVKRAKNPITAARRVMTDTRHVLLSGVGADKFAESIGLELVSADYFITEEQRSAWKSWQAREADRKKGAQIAQPRYLGTVGCVAIDSQGNIAAGTSTGGLMGKRWGRVGDSPVIGAGTYAANDTCGVSCTGTGEEFIRHNVAADLSARLRYANQSLSAAADTIIQKILPDDCGGLIAIDKQYNIAAQFNTAALARALADSSGRREIRLARE